MPIPSPADFRNKSKKHSEVREMMAQLAENSANRRGLTTVDAVDALIEDGLYTASTTNIAQAVGFPFGTAGQLLVSTTSNYVLQTYYLDTGEVFQRRKTVSGWSEFKGQLVRTLSGTDKLNDYTKPGIFQCVNNNAATEANNYPFTSRGILFVQTNGTTVTQHYLALTGFASRAYRLDQPEIGWESWRGVTFPAGITSLSSIAYKGENISRRIDSMSALNGHLDRAVTSGRWQTIVRSIATTENGFPITDTVGTLEVSSDGNLVVIQKWQTYKGTAYRYGSYNSQSVLTWQPWRGYINSENGLIDISNAVVVGKSPIKRISSLSEIGTHLDEVRTTGMWHTTLRSIATTENGFPITDVIGVIEVSASGTQAITQYWRSYKGLAVRWGSYNTQGVLTWQPWRGYLLSESGITQLGQSETTTTQTQLITFGSSTLEYLQDELQSLATLKNLRLRPNAKSGYTLGAAGLNQGTNKMSVQFASGVISTGINTVIIESSFNDDIRAAMTVELSNGVKGSLNYRDKTFTPSNLTTSLTVSNTEKYKVTVPLWNDINHVGGIFIFNIGKNSVSSSTDNSDYIVEKTVEMIESIPAGSKFIVGGHFSNWVGTTTETHHHVVHSVNQKLRLKYGLKYFDIAELFGLESTWTTLGLTKTADDIAAIAANRMPPSLSRDAAHMSAGMDLIVAQLIENKLIEFGYIQ